MCFGRDGDGKLRIQSGFRVVCVCVCENDDGIDKVFRQFLTLPTIYSLVIR